MSIKETVGYCIVPASGMCNDHYNLRPCDIMSHKNELHQLNWPSLVAEGSLNVGHFPVTFGEHSARQLTS